MTEDRLEFLGGLALLAIVAFSLTPAFWWLIAWLGR
jgi:hypothetical protein